MRKWTLGTNPTDMKLIQECYGISMAKSLITEVQHKVCYLIILSIKSME